MEQSRLDETYQSDRLHRSYLSCSAVRYRCIVLPWHGHRYALRRLMIYDYGKERRNNRGSKEDCEESSG